MPRGSRRASAGHPAGSAARGSRTLPAIATVFLAPVPVPASWSGLGTVPRRRRLRGLHVLPLRRRRSLIDGPWLMLRSARALLLLEVLPRHALARPVAVMLGSNRTKLFRVARIAVPRILPLVDGQRCGTWNGAAVPPVPSPSTPFPVVAPVVTPPWRPIRVPAVEVRRRSAVVAHRNAQHEQWHMHGLDHVPRPVVPAARVPVVSLVHPIHAVVEEVVRIRPGVVVDGIARHLDELRVRRHVDADADTGDCDADPDADLCVGRGQRDKQHRRGQKQVAHLRPSIRVAAIAVMVT